MNKYEEVIKMEKGNQQRKSHRDETKTTRPKASYRFT